MQQADPDDPCGKQDLKALQGVRPAGCESNEVLPGWLLALAEWPWTES